VLIDIPFSELLSIQKDLFFASASDTNTESILQQVSSLTQIQQHWAHDPSRDNVFPSLCVRSALDLYLQCRKFPAGSEVIMTSVNLPDMVNVLKAHDLIPVPLDLDPRTMAPVSVAKFQELLSDKVSATSPLSDQNVPGSLYLRRQIRSHSLR